MERERNANGTHFRTNSGRVPNAFSVRLFLSSTEHIVLFSVTILLTGCFSVVANRRIIFSDFQMGVCVIHFQMTNVLSKHKTLPVENCYGLQLFPCLSIINNDCRTIYLSLPGEKIQDFIRH